MSFKAVAWAFEHDGCGTSSEKLVLLAFANFVNARGHSYPSTETIARLTKLNPKTVRSSIDALERLGIIVDTGRRIGRTGQIKVYALAMESHPETDAYADEVFPRVAGRPQRPANDARPERMPETGALRGQAKAPVSGSKGTRNRETEPVLEPDTPEDANASSRPQGGRTRGARISPDWVPVPIAELPPQARAVAEQWPAGAYEAEAEAHLNYWLSEGRAGAAKVDWGRAWANRIVQLGAKPLRDARAGVRHAATGGAALPVSERAASLRKTAELYDRMGRCEEADELRAQAADIDVRRASG